MGRKRAGCDCSDNACVVCRRRLRDRLRVLTPEEKAQKAANTRRYRAKNLEQINAKNRLRYVQNREILLARSRKYAVDHSEALLAQKARYREQRRQELREKATSRYYEKRDVILERARAFRERHQKTINLRARCRKNKHPSPEQFVTLLREQNNCCASCGSEFASLRDAYGDHNHVTNTPRGILCNYCNTGAGFIEGPKFQLIFDYLKRWRDLPGAT